jgi:signal transduction histidine kinase
MDTSTDKITDLKGASVLIVDDTPENLHVARTLLEHEGYKVLVATDGYKALTRAEMGKPELILLDVQMPGIDGFETCRQLKTNNETKDIPVIYLSALADTSNIVKGFEFGAVDCITKPFRAEEVLARVRVHLTLKRLEKDLREAIASRNKFFRILAHDLKNPFVAILGFSDMLVADYDMLSDEERRSFATNTKEAAENTFKLLENLLAWAGTQVGSIKMEPKVIDISQSVENIFSITSGSAKTKDITLISTVEQGLQAYADLSMIETVIRNLVTNAIKFTRTGGSITVSAEKKEQMIQVSVEDTGVGIDSKVLPLLFDISHSRSTKGTSSEEGTGLGLILCREFVRKNSGDIWVESESGKGSRFTFSLPATHTT